MIVKMNVIEAYFLFKKRGDFQHIITLGNSIDAVILDMQELHPEETLNRDSVMSWKFLTTKDVDKLPAEAIGKLNKFKKVKSSTKKHTNAKQ